MKYLSKMRGGGQSPPRVSVSEIFWSWLGSLIGIGLITYLDSVLFQSSEIVLLIGPAGASAVLVFGATRSPLAQPRNLVGGHVISAIIGVMASKLFGSSLVLASAVAVSTSIAIMHLTKTLHPPGGATALIAVIGGEKIRQMGLLYVVFPAALSSMILLIVAVLFNNMINSRRYPDHWI
jgi:CBS-domain-containing membrane protein